MKPSSKWKINPTPYAMVIANAVSKKRGKKKRNPLKRRAKKPGMWVSKKPRANPTKAKKKTATKSTRRKHRARRVAKKSRNPLKIRHVIVEENPKRKVRRKGKSKRSASRSQPKRNPMKHRKTRRGKRRGHRKNPISRRSRSSRRSRRNPVSRRSGRRMGRRRNPAIGSEVKELFGQPMLTFAGGVVIVNVGTNTLMNWVLTPDAVTGMRRFDLPGVNYAKLASSDPLVRAQFYSDNTWVLAAYKFAVGFGVGYLLRNQSPRLAQGIYVGTVAGVISDVLSNTGIVNAQGRLAVMNRGTGRMFNTNGTGFVPGVDPQLTNPAQRFMVPTFGNLPQPRGAGAIVDRNTMRNLEMQSEGAFRGAN